MVCISIVTRKRRTCSHKRSRAQSITTLRYMYSRQLNPTALSAVNGLNSVSSKRRWDFRRVRKGVDDLKSDSHQQF